jgi:hypothetical protein
MCWCFRWFCDLYHAHTLALHRARCTYGKAHSAAPPDETALRYSCQQVLGSADPGAAALAAVGKLLSGAKDAIRGMVTADGAVSASDETASARIRKVVMGSCASAHPHTPGWVGRGTRNQGE